MDINDESDSLAYSVLPHRPHSPSRADSVAPNSYDRETYLENYSAGELSCVDTRQPPSRPFYLIRLWGPGDVWGALAQQKVIFIPEPRLFE